MLTYVGLFPEGKYSSNQAKNDECLVFNKTHTLDYLLNMIQIDQKESHEQQGAVYLINMLCHRLDLMYSTNLEPSTFGDFEPKTNLFTVSF